MVVRRLAKPVTGGLAALAAIAAAFVLGMRRKWPPVLDAVRRASRAMRPLLLKNAGREGAYASVIRHVGRTTGRRYETPVVAVATEDGFVIALPYGLNTDWLRNVLAAGTATVVTGGDAYEVDRPEVVPIEVATDYFAPREQAAHRRFLVAHCLRVHRLTSGA